MEWPLFWSGGSGPRVPAGLAAVLAVSLVVRLSAQGPVDPVFRPASDVERLLPQSSVYDILEDRAGFLWFGTREGVVRWDGYQVRTWKHDPFDSASVPGNVIRFLDQDRFGHIWLLAHSYLDRPAGIARLVGPDYQRIERFGADGHIVLDQNRSPVLVLSDSILIFDSVTARFGAGFSRAPPLVRSAGTFLPTGTAARDGSLWLLSPERGLERCDLAAGRCAAVPLQGAGWHVAGRLRQDRDGSVWIPHGREVYRWGDQGLHHVITLGPDDSAVDFGWSTDGTLWILGRAGVTHLRAGRPGRAPLQVLGGAANLAPVVLRVDRSGAVWAGTVWGLYRHHPGAPVFGHREHDPRNDNSPSAGLVVSLAESGDGAVWIGTIGGGLNRWNRSTDTFRRFRSTAGEPRSLTSDVIWSLAADPQGAVWVGTDRGLNRISREGQVGRLFRVDPSLDQPLVGSPNSVSDLAIDRAGRVWMACGIYCGDSLFFYDPQRRRFGGVATPGVVGAGYLHPADSSTLLIGALSGVHRFNPTAGQILSSPESGQSNLDGILAFLPARDGGLWLGTNSGLYRFDASGRMRARYTERDGLPGNAVYGLLEDRRGRIWGSTNRGLVAVEPDSQGIAVRTYDQSNGLSNTEFNRNAALATRDGTFLFGGDRGLTFFDPEGIEPNRYRPPVVITSVRRSTQRTTRVVTDPGSEPLRIAPDDYTFTIEFAALNYRNPHRNRYQVMLEGFDAEWRSQGHERRTTYTNVPPGSYRFMVRGSNDDGIWNETPAVLAVIVEPAFWETAWFRLGLGAAVVGLIAFATWYVSRSRYRLQLQTARAEHALALERTRISRDMHDEVGANLTEITILSELALADGDDRTRLERIGAKSRATLDSIAEIVWATDPRNDDGDRFVAYLREVAAEYLESAGLDAQLDFPVPGALGSAGPDCRRTVLLVIKEALANVVRHAGARSVGVSLEVSATRIRAIVRDDGRGIGPDAGAGGGNGLRNIRSRAEEAGGSVILESLPGGGTAVTVELPITGGSADRGGGAGSP
ncbi:MAG: hypothetical protein KF785_13125 [Gemmatimonadales bacterium]|nr:hypothetical protein [Gemmatimonadales bacterium]